jgi:hypothetical protein
LKDVKQMISVRIEESDRASVQTLANRLFSRESDIYRFAISHLCARLSCLLDTDCNGSDLLLTLTEIRDELRYVLGIKKLQLERVINNSRCPPEKYVAMSDVELLLMPEHVLKQHLLRLYPMPRNKNNIEEWLKDYLIDKYSLERALSVQT